MPRTGSTAKVFSVMCCIGLVPVVLWCWCFVCWSSWHPVRQPLHSRASKLSPSHLIHTAAGALKLNPTMLEVKSKLVVDCFYRKHYMQRISSRSTEQDLVLPRIFRGGSRWERRGHIRCAGASMYFRDPWYFQ